MLRGVIIVTCPHCGKAFIAPDFELGATALSAPVDCPHCGRQVDPNGCKGLFVAIYKWLTRRIHPFYSDFTTKPRHSPHFYGGVTAGF